MYHTVRPHDIGLMSRLPNQEEASQFMLHQIDFNEDARQVLPSVPSVSELQNFSVSPQRHAAYENMWRMMTYVGIVGNAAIWLYF